MGAAYRAPSRVSNAPSAQAGRRDTQTPRVARVRRRLDRYLGDLQATRSAMSADLDDQKVSIGRGFAQWAQLRGSKRRKLTRVQLVPKKLARSSRVVRHCRMGRAIARGAGALSCAEEGLEPPPGYPGPGPQPGAAKCRSGRCHRCCQRPYGNAGWSRSNARSRSTSRAPGASGAVARTARRSGTRGRRGCGGHRSRPRAGRAC
jgi:hypothetical protein